MEIRKSWYAVYTKPRWEKKVKRLLENRHIECYCPLNKVRRQWSDRIKTVEEPLFKSYVFVLITPGDLQKVRLVQGILNFVYWQGKPAPIKPEEIEMIRKFMMDYEDVKAISLDIKPFDSVVINSGVLVGRTGRVIKVLQNTVEVELKSLGFKLIAKFDKRSLAPIDRTVEKGIE